MVDRFRHLSRLGQTSAPRSSRWSSRRPMSPACSTSATCSSTPRSMSPSAGIACSAKNTLWLPGTDHAGIATQMVVERKLAEEGIKRLDLGREEFEKRVWEWKAQYGDTIKRQMIRLGASCDWSRERFTLDPGLSRAVREVFVRLYEKGLIYRGEYMVNWCPRCHTALSDLEVAHAETDGHPLAPALSRQRPARPLPHRRHHAPRDHARRYRRRHQPQGRALSRSPRQDRATSADGSRNPHHPRRSGRPRIRHRRRQSHPRARSQRFRSRPPPQPAEDPSHRRTRRHDRRTPAPTPASTASKPANAWSPISKKPARWSKIEPYKLNLGKCDRCKTVVEPLISTQWFVKTKPLAEKAIEAVESGRIEFIPANWTKTYDEWMYNIRDWCISRQLWWGHRIPAWHCDECREDHRRARRLPPPARVADRPQLKQDHRRARHLVQLRPVAVFHARLARSDRGPRRLLSHVAAHHRLRHSLLLGGAHGHARHRIHGRRAVPPGLHSRPGARRREAEDVEDPRQRHRPAGGHRKVRHRRRPHGAAARRRARHRHRAHRAAHGKLAAPSPTRSGTPRASSS